MTGRYGVWSVESLANERAVTIVIGPSAQDLHRFQSRVVNKISKPWVLETVLLDVVVNVFKDEVVNMGRYTEPITTPC